MKNSEKLENLRKHMGEEWARSLNYQWRDIGDGNPIRVRKCPMCGIAPANVDDCGEFGNPECPYFGVGLEEYNRRFPKTNTDN